MVLYDGQILVCHIPVAEEAPVDTLISSLSSNAFTTSMFGSMAA